MVQLTTSTLLALLLVAPCIAIPVIQHNTEDHSVELAASEPKLPKTHTKIRIHARPRHIVHKLKHHQQKEAIRRVAAALYKRSDGELSERDIEDIQLVIREFDDLVAREPLFGGLWRKVKHLVSVKNIKTGIDIAKSLKARELSPELEALAAREPVVDAILKTAKELSAPTGHANDATKPHHGNDAHQDNPDMYERDLEVPELDAREPEPFLDFLWRKVKPVATKKNIQAASDIVRTFAREEHPEVFERDYELNELD